MIGKQSSLEQPDSERKIPLLGIVGALLVTVAATIFLLHQQSGPPVLSSEFLAEHGDTDPLGGLQALPDAFAVIEARVTAFGGPEVVLDANGFVSYDSDAHGFPHVFVTPDKRKSVRSLGRGNDNVDLVKRLRSAFQDSPLKLWHSEGQLEEGHVYAFFVGTWGASEFSILYAYDLDEEDAAPGFRRASGTQLSLLEESGKTKFAQLVSLSRELYGERYKGEARGRLTELVLGPAPFEGERPSRPPDSDSFPSEADVGVEEQADLMHIEVIVILPDDTYAEYALKDSSNKRLGWFGSNDNGYVILSGFIDRAGGEFQLLSRASGAQESTALPLAAFGIPGNKIAIPRSEAGETGVVVDLRDGADDVLDVFVDTDLYFERLEELEPVLDGGLPEGDGVSNP